MNEKETKTKLQIILDAVCGIVMILAIISYLLVGFLSGIWHPTWLIMACSALACGIIGIVGTTYSSLKASSSQKQNDQEKKDN